MKNNRWLLYLVGLAVVVALIAYASHHAHFNWSVLAAQVHYVSWDNIVFGAAMIYLAYIVRAVRWAVFLKRTKKVGLFSLLGTQVIGFTAVALLGRVADLTRPYLVARKTRTDLGLQVAVYAVERMFDAGSMVLIFALTLLLAPDRASLPHADNARRFAEGGLAGCVALIALAFAVRLSGEAIASWAESKIKSKAGTAIAAKIRAFRDGLSAISSIGDFLQAAGLSLLMWAMIASGYLSTVRAFNAAPALAHMTLTRCVILMVASMASSVVPIPVVSWFAQILALQQTMQQLFLVRPEPALACGTALLVVTFMSIIPVGLIWSRFEHVSLKAVSEEAEHLGDEAVAAVEA